MSETNGRAPDESPASESRILSLTDAPRRPLGKASDLLTRKQCAQMIQDALASELPKIHAFYLEQIPAHTARMIMDALLHYGLIRPAEPTDIAPTDASTSPAERAESPERRPETAALDAIPDTTAPADTGDVDTRGGA